MLKLSDFNLDKFINEEYFDTLPELYDLKEVIEYNIWHENESVFDHSLEVIYKFKEILSKLNDSLLNYLGEKVTYYSRKDILFLSILLHDIAKKDTFKINDEGITSCPNHELEGAIKSENILDRFDLSSKEKIWLKL